MKNLSNYKVNNNFYEKPLALQEGLNIVQVGRYYCKPGEDVVAHYHYNFFELSVITDGKGTIITNNQQINVQKNDIYVSFPYEKHELISSEDEPMKYDNIAFSWNETPYRQPLQNILRNFYPADMRIIHDQKINQLVSFLLGEFNTKLDFYEDNLKYIILSIIIYTIRKFQEKESPSHNTSKLSAEILCTRIMNFIDVNIYEMQSLNDINKITNYNPSYISTLFKKTTGITLREYFLNKKMEIAHLMLQEGKLKICEIAEILHYSDGNALSKAYKQKYGISPKSHRSETRSD